MLSIKNLKVARVDKIVLESFNLVLESGSLHVLMGPNGSGKSTLAYTLMGHPGYTVCSGQAMLDGVNLFELPVEKRARLGLFLACQYPQEVPGVSLFTFLREAHTMLTREELSLQDFKERLYALMDRVKLDYSFAYRNLNDGFSGGEKKRLEMLQLLLFKPSVAILDEIDSGLDIDGLKIIAQALQTARQENPKLTLLLITHYQRILSYIQPDYVHVLLNGTIVKSGESILATEIEACGYDGLSL
jgi:Fe-S cluster assembly ATP-binding protein